MSVSTASSLGVILLLVAASGSQFLKQGLLASWFEPSVYAGWATAVLASQLLFNFGGLGFQNYAARYGAIYESRGKRLLIRNLISKQLLIYTYVLPISIPVIYFLLAKPELEFFAIMLGYAFANVYLNAATNPIYLKSSRQFASIQALRGVGSTVIAVFTCYTTDSLFFTLINESIFIIVLGRLTIRRQNFSLRFKHFLLDRDCRVLFPFFLPVLLSTVAVSLSRLIAIDLLNEQLLGTYYFMFLLVSCGVMFQYGLSVFLGPIITSKLATMPAGDLNSFAVRCWFVVVCLALLCTGVATFIFPILVDAFYKNYSQGLVLMVPMLLLAAAKMCDIWSVFFLLAGFEKYLFAPHLVSIVLAVILYFLVVDTNNMQLADMQVFIVSEAAAIFFVPLVFFFLIRKDNLPVK